MTRGINSGTMLTCQNGYVAPAGKKGRGVFARKKLKTSEVVEVSPYIHLPRRDGKTLTQTMINSYWFDLENQSAAIGLGHTSMYNHSQTPNAEFSINRKRRTITIKTLKAIQPDEEITISYGYELELPKKQKSQPKNRSKSKLK